jgi:hypothetical protein
MSIDGPNVREQARKQSLPWPRVDGMQRGHCQGLHLGMTGITGRRMPVEYKFRSPLILTHTPLSTHACTHTHTQTHTPTQRHTKHKTNLVNPPFPWEVRARHGGEARLHSPDISSLPPVSLPVEGSGSMCGTRRNNRGRHTSTCCLHP